jgi:hypothetical protein
MASPKIETKNIVMTAFLRELSVGPVPSLERHHFARGDPENRLYLRMPAIVPGVGFAGERLTCVDRDSHAARERRLDTDALVNFGRGKMVIRSGASVVQHLAPSARKQ